MISIKEIDDCLNAGFLATFQQSFASRWPLAVSIVLKFPPKLTLFYWQLCNLENGDSNQGRISEQSYVDSLFEERLQGVQESGQPGGFCGGFFLTNVNAINICPIIKRTLIYIIRTKNVFFYTQRK